VNILFTGEYFHWIIASRIAELILGYWGVAILFILILLKNQIKNRAFFLSFLASSLLYIVVVARGNVQHSYYQIPIMSTIAIYLGIGSNFFLNPPREYVSKWASYAVFIVCCVFTLAFSWFTVRDYFNINNP